MLNTEFVTARLFLKKPNLTLAVTRGNSRVHACWQVAKDRR